MNPVKLATLATEITDIILWDGDDKYERDALAAEIFDWLSDGDLTGNETADELAQEWQEREDMAAEATTDYE